MTNDPIDNEFAEMQHAMGLEAVGRLFPGMTLEEVTAAVEEELILAELDPSPLSEAELNAMWNAMKATRMLADAIFADTEHPGPAASTDEELAEAMIPAFQKRNPSWPLDITATAAIVAEARRAASDG